MHVKDFNSWNDVKKVVDGNMTVRVREGEVRWLAMGVNVGSEIDGKGAHFTRPALVVHCIGDKLTLIIPLTTSNKNIPGYLPFEWKGRKDNLCLHQMKIVSTKRLLNRVAKISDTKLKAVKEAIKKFYNL